MEVIGPHHVPTASLPTKKPDTHCIGGSVGPRAGLEVLEKRGISYPYWGASFGPSNSQRSRYRTAVVDISTAVVRISTTLLGS
jgi:hypothetical protein